jgi:tetrathionate reductase subunit C
MDVNILYNVEHEIHLGFLIANYFYLTGLSAGSFILSTLAYGFGIEKYKPVGKVGVVLATLLLILAPVNLFLDLAQPFRFWHLFLYLRITSPITWGSFLLTLYPLNCMIYGYFMFKGDAKKTKFFGLIGIPLALLVHGYTGFILALGKARVLWNTAIMPPIFLISAMVSGIALMILVVVIKGYFFSHERKVDTALCFDLGKMLAWAIIVDLAFIATDILVLLTSHTEAYLAAMMLLKGSMSHLFIGVEVILGSIIPLFFLFFPPTKNRISFIVLSSILVMIGIFTMRYVMVVGGLSIPLS